jgi:hypothetical protein
MRDGVPTDTERDAGDRVTRDAGGGAVDPLPYRARGD